MKSDTNPSVIFGLYCKPEKYNEFLEALKEKNLGVREIRFVDVEIPMDRYDETINFFKEFIMLDFWEKRNPLNRDFPFKKTIIKKLEKEMQFKPIDLTNANWKQYKAHPLLWTLAVPLLCQPKPKYAETKEEKDNMKKLEKFESEGYLNDEQIEEKAILEEIEEMAEKEIEEAKLENEK